jgi:DNA polymerase III delta subunit
MTEMISNSTHVECKKMKEYGHDYPLWIRAKASEVGYEMEDGADEVMYARVGANLFALTNELKKLIAVKEAEKAITTEDVEQYVSVTTSSTLYDLLERLLRRDMKGSIRCYESYCKSNMGQIELVAFIGAYLEKLYRMLLLREQNMSVEEIGDILMIPGFIVRTKYMPRALSIGKRGLATYLNRACELDANLRLFRGDKKLLVEKFIYGFAQ